MLIVRGAAPGWMETLHKEHRCSVSQQGLMVLLQREDRLLSQRKELLSDNHMREHHGKQRSGCIKGQR
ncbi:hypothetical protein NQZ68_018201 [Dissostichus eleginoides]|nr:hypothetical protein NQZ68_018201 [Dissostichus eleginoides]